MVPPFAALVQAEPQKHLCRFLLLAGTIALAGCHLRPNLKPYAGQWVLNARPTGDGTQNGSLPLMTLKLEQHHHQLTGILLSPQYFDEKADGTFNSVKTPLKSRAVTGVRWDRPQLDLAIGEHPDREYLPIMLADPDHLILAGFHGHVPPWRFERVTSLPDLQIETHWQNDSTESPN
jgi:hypothetical protein